MYELWKTPGIQPAGFVNHTMHLCSFFSNTYNRDMLVEGLPTCIFYFFGCIFPVSKTQGEVFSDAFQHNRQSKGLPNASKAWAHCAELQSLSSALGHRYVQSSRERIHDTQHSGGNVGFLGNGAGGDRNLPGIREERIRIYLWCWGGENEHSGSHLSCQQISKLLHVSLKFNFFGIGFFLSSPCCRRHTKEPGTWCPNVWDSYVIASLRGHQGVQETWSSLASSVRLC